MYFTIAVNVVADVDEALGDDAGERGADRGVGDCLHRLGGAGASGFFARGLGLATRGLLVVLLLGDRPFGEETDVSLAVGARPFELLGGARRVRLRLRAREGGGAGVELGEDGPLGDLVAALD